MEFHGIHSTLLLAGGNLFSNLRMPSVDRDLRAGVKLWIDRSSICHSTCSVRAQQENGLIAIIVVTVMLKGHDIGVVSRSRHPGPIVCFIDKRTLDPEIGVLREGRRGRGKLLPLIRCLLHSDGNVMHLIIGVHHGKCHGSLEVHEITTTTVSIGKQLTLYLCRSGGHSCRLAGVIALICGFYIIDALGPTTISTWIMEV